jgi:Ca2+-binding RTX toxin-like protein
MALIEGDTNWLNFNDDLSGTSSADTIIAKSGKDVVRGGGGNDLIFGGYDSTDNVLDGGDTLYGDAGNDTIYGGYGNDYLNGGTEADRLFGGAGYDTLIGGSGNDTLNGGNGFDLMDPTGEVDSLTGGSGNDRFEVLGYVGLLGSDKAVITDWNAGGAQDRLVLQGKYSDYSFQISGGVLNVSRNIFDIGGVLTGRDLVAQVFEGTTMSDATLSSNVQSNLIFV